LDYNPWMSNLKNYVSSVCKKTGELQRFMYFHYSSQCEAKCAFLALRIYCWRLRTKIVSLIKKPHNPVDTKTLKQLSSSFGTPKQNLCYYRSTMGSISFWSCFWIKNIYPQITPFCSSKHSTFPPSPRPHIKRTASVACL